MNVSHNSSQPRWSFPSKSLPSWQSVQRLQPKVSYANAFIALSLMDGMHGNDFPIAMSALLKQAALADVYFCSKAYFF